MLEADAALYRSDRALVNALLLNESNAPSDDDVVTAARLFSRYINSSQESLVADIERAMANWGYSIADAQGRARTLWQSGYRPSVQQAELVGSGADTQQETA